MEKVRTASSSPSKQLINQVHKQLQNGEKRKGQRIADLFELAPLYDESCSRIFNW